MGSRIEKQPLASHLTQHFHDLFSVIIVDDCPERTHHI